MAAVKIIVCLGDMQKAAPLIYNRDYEKIAVGEINRKLVYNALSSLDYNVSSTQQLEKMRIQNGLLYNTNEFYLYLIFMLFLGVAMLQRPGLFPAISLLIFIAHILVIRTVSAKNVVDRMMKQMSSTEVASKLVMEIANKPHVERGIIVYDIHSVYDLKFIDIMRSSRSHLYKIDVLIFGDKKMINDPLVKYVNSHGLNVVHE